MYDALFIGFDKRACQAEIDRFRLLLADAPYADSFVAVRVVSEAERLIGGAAAPFVEIRSRGVALVTIQRDLRERLSSRYSIADGHNTLWLEPVSRA